MDLNQSANRALVYAAGEAIARGYAQTDTEHLLLGLATAVGTSAYKLLSDSGIEYRDIARSVHSTTCRVNGKVPDSEAVEKIVLEGIHNRRGDMFGTLDLLAGICNRECEGKRLLTERGFDPARLESAFKELKED